MQEIASAHSDSIWVAKFSPCGKYLATGGKDACLKVWKVKKPVLDQKDEVNEGDEERKDGKQEPPLLRRQDRRQKDYQHSFRPDLSLLEEIPAWEFREHAQDIVDISWNDNSE